MVTKSVTKWFNPQCDTRILIKLLLSMTYIFIVFLMWVSPLVHDAIQLIVDLWTVRISTTAQ